MAITQFTGKTLLQEDTLGRIQKEVAGLLSDKDVAGAYAASQHIKTELSNLPKEDVAPVLLEYRKITSSLKALALPVLSGEEVEGLLANNLEFLDTQSEPLVVSGLSAWLASQPDDVAGALKEKFRSRLDQDAPFAPKLSAMLAELPREGRASPAAFAPRDDGFLVPSEREDVSQSARKASAVSARPPADSEIDSIARNFYSLAGSREGEEAFVRRGAALVRSRLRDVRTRAEFSDYAARPFAAGGLGLSGEYLDRAERMVQEAYERAHRIGRAVSAAPLGAASTPEPKPPQETQPPGPAQPQGESQKEVDALIAGATEDTALADLLKGKNSPSVQSSPSAPVPPPAAPRRSAVSSKPRMDDVTPPKGSVDRAGVGETRAMGLSDELGTVTLADFRSLGAGAVARQTILGKIATLEGESIAQKAAGVRALRRSPLFGAYLAVGDAALAGGRKLVGALADPAVNPERMTEDEFFTIADLAGKLK